MDKRKVVVTAVNACCSLGHDIDTVWHNLKQGNSGIKPISRFNAERHFTKIGGEIDDAYRDILDLTGQSAVSKNGELSLLCGQGLFLQENAKGIFESYPDIGLILGSGLGGLYFSEDNLKKMYETGGKRIHPMTVPNVDPNSIVSALSRRWQIHGHQFSISTACSSGANAIGTALDLIRNGRLDCIVTGGVEYTFTTLLYAGFDQLRAMSRCNDTPETSCKPFSQGRDGFIMGEGAAMLVLESEERALSRGATILAELTGYGVTGGAYHVVKPIEDGSDGKKAMALALSDAGIDSDNIDFISPHGTGTALNDQAEYNAMAALFGPKTSDIPVVPIKQLTGHMLGASGALEAVHTVKCIEDQIVTPIAYYQAEANQKLNISVGEANQHSIKHAMSNSFGFGNNNVSLIMSQYHH
ncbi:beta-ketoacyl-[acyl-carrier-protein] synthase family protein [Catenovulum sediminis]|uniref:Beta-ketoacyl-[acyl-carrier-protein] synthase family protein n=1 Tax=Catenovulum sediminis TaxID=1740262 RepID=A0ABV1RCK0_9ALTE|nr:beta-ketoacyl-[acyl-carrier-protein] synthase family protein [Catenovulum sediminis]